MWVYFLIVSFLWDYVFLCGIISFSQIGAAASLGFFLQRPWLTQGEKIKRKPCLGTTVDLGWARLKGLMQDYSRNDAAKGSMLSFRGAKAASQKLALCFEMAVLGAKQRGIPSQMSPPKSLQSLCYLPGLLSPGKKYWSTVCYRSTKAGGFKTKNSSLKNRTKFMCTRDLWIGCLLGISDFVGKQINKEGGPFNKRREMVDVREEIDPRGTDSTPCRSQKGQEHSTSGTAELKGGLSPGKGWSPGWLWWGTSGPWAIKMAPGKPLKLRRVEAAKILLWVQPTVTKRTTKWQSKNIVPVFSHPTPVVVVCTETWHYAATTVCRAWLYRTLSRIPTK